MSLDQIFCASPWFHMRITNNGHFAFCRWSQNSVAPESIQDHDPVEWFQSGVSPIRQQMLQGQKIDACQGCYKMEHHGKVSGRQKQLLKVGVMPKVWKKSLRSSPWFAIFEKSYREKGYTEQTPQDWQIDLGNHCNSACLFCSPEYSSRLANDLFRIGRLDQLPDRNWAEDPALLQKFINSISGCEKVSYLHFIGGETLITPAFKSILQSLISEGLNRRAVIGFTTNLTVWRADIAELLCEFSEVNLGMSVECLHPVNDYIRYGGNLDRTQNLMHKWISLAKSQPRWFTQIRTTPTLLSILHLSTIYEYAWNNEITVESCNFLNQPAFMRPTVLPDRFRQQASAKIRAWIQQRSSEDTSDQIINIRNPAFSRQQLIQDAESYVDWLDGAPDESHLLPDLLSYLDSMQSLRGNSILNYLPEYEELFRPAGL